MITEQKEPNLNKRCFKCSGLGWYFDTGMISNDEYANQNGVTPKVNTERQSCNPQHQTLLERPIVCCNMCDGSGVRGGKHGTIDHESLCVANH